jgi:hypothetical protein
MSGDIFPAHKWSVITWRTGSDEHETNVINKKTNVWLAAYEVEVTRAVRQSRNECTIQSRLIF